MVKRTKTGCITCRIRRVKCDETKPQCRNCSSSRRVCDGYLPNQQLMSRRQLAVAARNLSVIGPIAKALSQTPPSSSHHTDVVLFDYFRKMTSPKANVFVSSPFWEQMLPQLAHAGDEVFWYTAVALGALHRKSEGDGDSALLTRQAASNYGKALVLAKNVDSPYKTLALRLALVAVANLLSRWGDAHQHIFAGLQAATRVVGRDVAGLTGTLARLDLQAMTFNDSQSPYPYMLAAPTLAGCDKRTAVSLFESYEQAASVLFSHIKRFMLLAENCALDAEVASIRREALVQDVAAWEMGMAAFESSSGRQTNHVAAAFNRIYHTWIRLLLKATMTGPETRWDACLWYFERLVGLAGYVVGNIQHGDKPLFSLELGLVVPLFSTAHRCRHPVLRRRAAGLLKRLNSREGVWRSDGAAAAAEMVIAMEEIGVTIHDCLLDNHEAVVKEHTGLYTFPWEAWSMPSFKPLPNGAMPTGIPAETSRAREILVVSNFEERKVDLKLLMSSGDQFVPFGAVQDVVVYF